MGENKSNSAKIPPHIFGEIVKTKKGLELLENTTYLQGFIDDIKSKDTSILTKRASLWAIGHIGQSKKGIELLL